MSVTIKNVRLSFPDLFEAVQYQNQGPFNYRATFLAPKGGEVETQLRAEVKKVAADKWGAKAEANLKAISAGGKIFMSDGDAKDYNGYAGNVAIVATRGQDSGAPVVVDQQIRPITKAMGKIYSGCYVNAKISIWAQDNSFGKGIRCTLEAVQFVKDGESFGGAMPASADGFDEIPFDDVEIAEEDLF